MNDQLFTVADQIVLVSGASRGIGRAIAEGFAQRGATVVITGRLAETVDATAEEICPEGGTVRAKVCDVVDAEAIRRTVDEVIDEFGRIDTLVNCAGVNRRMKVEEYTDEDFDFVTNINFRGAFMMAQAAGRKMIAAGKGSVVNIDSINSHRPLDRVTPYAMSKAAVSSMTRSMAMEWGPMGVRVNAVAPGFTLTALTVPLWEENEQNAERCAWRRRNTPLRRIGQPEDMIGATVFLASEAAAYVTGQVLYVDGGTTCGLFWPM